ncbi:MAG: hypothetical protein CSA45_05265 [Gammaproteobacteria bacterium]|nr:MAG: hypothetical protein CSA45_05265 [Gammaproteobacteria bacterium]
MMSNEEQQVIAIAATIQSLTNVNDIATKGKFDEYRAAPVLQALVHYNPDDTLSAYGGDIGALYYGLTQLQHLFSDNLNRDIAQYLLAVVSVELRVVRQQRMRQILQTELQSIASDVLRNGAHHSADHEAFDDDGFDDDDVDDKDKAISSREEDNLPLNQRLVTDTTIARFADVYKKTASQTEPRIMIKGHHEYLQNELSANRIRALLLAALRGAAFFRHYGGKRIDFMLKRKQFLAIAKQLT